MAGTSANDFTNGGPFYLDPTQQDLLLAALASNQQDQNGLYSALNANPPVAGSHFGFPVDGAFDANVFTSPQQSTPANAFTTASIDESPFVDYLDGDNSFDFDGSNEDLMIGALPGESPPAKTEEDGTEKRKSPGDDVEDRDGGAKRREGEDKQAKKPGRKPLTSEPTTVSFLDDAVRHTSNTE
jgi:AP-1-like factor